MAWAVASVSGASSRRRSARTARVSAMAAVKAAQIRVADRPAEEGRGDRGGGTIAGARGADTPEGDEQRLTVRGALCRSREQVVDQGRVEEQLDPRCPERQPETESHDDRREQLTVGSGQHGLGRPVVGPGPDRALETDRLVRRVRGEDEASARRRPGPDRLREPLPVVLDEPDGPLHDLARAAVVDLEVDPSQTRQERLEPEDPPDVGESPAVDRLVVVADEEDPVGRSGQQQGEPELGAVDVLDLVDQQLPAAIAPAGEQVRVAFQLGDRAQDEVIEIESAAGRHGGLVGHERAGDRSRARRPPRPRRPRRPARP